ncbi:hypothetical protein LDI01_14820 [Lentilactobacillus diolivorans]|uniref:Uncharacterized protein n=1 Tax=Lentilactobacillus diolivorans TaxID=179838 RepID=A0ABQ0XI04_9LACO|nr:hypothetical protein LDI01_14820 [Lentilactobacillus diolivorans]
MSSRFIQKKTIYGFLCTINFKNEYLLKQEMSFQVRLVYIVKASNSDTAKIWINNHFQNYFLKEACFFEEKGI